MFMAAILYRGKLWNDLFSSLEELAGVLLIDTEQSEFDVQRVAKRIPEMLDEVPDNFNIYALRTANTANRLIELENAIKRHHADISFVVIDGIADLVMDINDRAECVRVITKLMQWSTQYNIHIHCVLHENKGSTDARGHLGTEMTNKSETVLRIEKDPSDPMNLSKVSGEYTRGIGFEDFVFRIDERGLPIIDKDAAFRSKVRKKSNGKSKKPTDFEPKQHLRALKKRLDLNTEYKKGDAMDRMTLGFEEDGINLSVRVARKFFAFYLSERYIVQTKENSKSPNQTYLFVGDKIKLNGVNYNEL
jgi:hypothetical protein